MAQVEPRRHASPGIDWVLAGGGEMGERIRAIDWARGPLGPVESWPQSLRTCVRIVLTSRQPMCVWWGESLINLYNDAYRSVLGGKHPGALGKPASVVWREVWDAVGPRAAATMLGNEGTYDEALLLILERNGYAEETYCTFSYSPVPDETGGTGGLICASTDDTQRILSERRLALLREQATKTVQARTVREACARSAAALAADPRDIPFALIYLCDPGGRTASLAATTGIEPGHRAAPESLALGAGIWPVAEVLATREVRIVALDASFGELPKGPWPCPPARAVVLPIALSAEPSLAGAIVVALNPHRLLEDSYRSFLGLVVGQIASSISTAHAYEEQEWRRQALAEIDRAKTTFFSNVSHEFRTPLTLMLAPIEDMRATLPRGSEERDRVELLHRNAMRLLKLVNNLLDFSRIEAGRVEATFEPTDLAAFTAELASTFRSAVERAGLSLRVDCARVPEPAYVDRDMWEKIVMNLLSNAFKFTFEGGIQVRLRTEASGVELEVADTGTGIAEHELPRLFERFHRIEGPRSRSHEGSGIGLALVHELVRQHGGDIRVTSCLGQGTTFHVRIPRGTAHLPRERIRAARTLPSVPVSSGAYVEEAWSWVMPADEPAPPSPPATTEAAARERIVVADDNADMRSYIARLLGEHWDVETVRDGNEALAAIRRYPPSLVLCDVMMPGLDGFALLRVVRADAELRGTPVILLSARAGEEATAEGLGAGADDYLVKPFTARELLMRVTARLAAARASREMVRQRASLYRAFLHAPFPVAIFRGPDHTIESVNEAALRLWDKTMSVIGQPLREALPHVRQQRLPGLLDEVYRSGQVLEGREQHARLPGGPGRAMRDMFFNYVYAPLLDARGAVEGVMLCAFDVSEQVTAQQRVDRARAEAEALAAQLTVTSERLEAAQRVGGIGIFDWELRERRVYWSPEVYGLLGLARNAIEPSPFALTKAVQRDDRGVAWGAFRRAVVSRANRFEIEVRLRQPQGKARWVRLSSLVFYDEKAEPSRLLGAIVDIETLKTSARELELANRAKDEFLATMSHELRTPLNAVLGWATILSKKPRAEPQLDQGLEVIGRNARTLERLVSDLLDVSRIISGKLQLRLRETDLTAVIQAAADVVRAAADAKGVRLVVDLGPDLGSIVGDPDRLQQVIWNLLTNAVRFTGPDGWVTVTAERAETCVHIRVEDTGLGIPRAHLPHIFERFRQVDSSTTRAHGGLGLGLAIVRHLVEAHGGSVEAHSEGEGHGATFVVNLPVRAVDVAPASSEATARSERVAETGPGEVPDLRGVRVLVVDDDPDSLDLCRTVLGSADARVTTVRSAREALDATGPFDLVISDIGMPEMDGYSLIRRVRSRAGTAYLPAIALTAYARAEDAERAMRAGYQQHLRKPVEPEALLEAVRAWTRSRRVRRFGV